MEGYIVTMLVKRTRVASSMVPFLFVGVSSEEIIRLNEFREVGEVFD